LSRNFLAIAQAPRHFGAGPLNALSQWNKSNEGASDMNIQTVILFSCLLSTQALAYPISYLFSGSSISMTNTNGGETTHFDVDSPLIVNGQTLLDGDIELIGRLSFDSDLLNVASCPSPACTENLIKSITFNLTTEGLLLKGQGSMAAPLWSYSDNTISFHLESFGSGIVDRMNFTLNLDDLTGALDFSDFALMAGGKLTARIDQAFSLAPVPVPGSIVLLSSALLGLNLRKWIARR